MNQAMGRAKGLAGGFTPGQRGIILVAALGLILGAFALTRWVAQPTWTPLFGETSSADTQKIVEELQSEGAQVTTIEGLADGDDLHPMQVAFREQHGLQCGYCTPGMVLAAVSLLAENPRPSEREVREGLEGNLCRCTGYHNIVKAVLSASGQSGIAILDTVRPGATAAPTVGPEVAS